MMFERLDKMRAELERAKQRRADADAKVKALEAKLKEAENNQIIADVKGINADQEMTIDAKKKDILYAVPGWSYVAHVYDFMDTTPATDITIGTPVSKITINQAMLSSKSRMTKAEIIGEIRMLISSVGVTPRIQKQLRKDRLLV